MNTHEDRAILYSSGVAEFDRGITVSETGATSVSVRVKRDELADLLASFEVFGDVRFVSPPTWDGSGQPPTLTIDPHAGLPSLLVQIAGARVELEHEGQTTIGELVGVHDETRGGEGDPWQERFVGILTEGAIVRIALAKVRGVRVLDATLQAELDRALRQRLESMRPSATTLRFEIAPSDESTAVDARMRYTIPAAAWKISYRLRIVDEAVVLAAFAIVDNDGEEDWNDLRITVVTGEPISFTTDLAEARRPARKRVRLVADEAFGAVEVEEGFEDFGEPVAVAAAAPMMAKRSRALRGGEVGAMDAEHLEAASFDAAQAREVGEFQVFETAEPVTIKKGESAAIPLFELELGESRSVLHYRRAEHPERPWRAIDFVHDGDFALGRGVCTVTEDGVFAGTCLMPGLKPGSDALLAHALETGVRVRFEERGFEERRTGFVFGGGVLVTKSERRRRVSYRIKNGRDETFALLLDHELAMADAEIDCRVHRDGSDEEIAIESRLSQGFRVRFDLHGKEELALEILETAQVEQSVHVSTSDQIEWLFDVFLEQEPGLADRQELRALAATRQELERHRRDLEERRREHDRLRERQERLRKNVEALHRHEHAERWRDELSTSEARLFVIEDSEIPALEAKERECLERLEQEIVALSLAVDG